MIIVVSGTPGVGKTSVCSILSNMLKMEYVHVSKFVIERKLYKGYDQTRSSFEIDDQIVAKELNDYLREKSNVVIETVYPSLIDQADKVVVLRKNPKVLYEELSRRGWTDLKVIENVEAEILGYVAQEAHDWFKDVCEIDTTNLTPEQVVNKILNNSCDSTIDWLSYSEIQDLLLTLDKVIS
ncbi:adenylate kinase family protein [Metallosphaera hakonensis]|uniref:Putative adenylate kinase n=1 Tax=Metallosphaera hakonensis JCM 8857 = DSM 7519 TaxID=1293036 RepID=A0A2U9IUB0_9CREN|nr:adenylate kinase family protein [Metallosphaera hakonensis]AWR99573.1 AAA family ATPase [Metallosphaera hakonensis JCM 8857 = DSM 7519]